MATDRSIKFSVKTEGGGAASQAVDGVTISIEEADAAAKKAARTFGDLNKAASSLGQQANSVGGAWNAIKISFEQGHGILGKLSGAMNAAKGGFDVLTSGIKNFGGAIQGAMGLLGPYSALIGGLIAGVTALWDKFADTAPPAMATAALDRQAEAAAKLAQKLAAVNDTISASQAQRQVKAEEAAERQRKAYSEAQASLSSLEAQIQIKRNELEEARRTVLDKQVYDLNSALWDDSYAVYYEKKVGSIEKALKRLEEAHQEAIKTVREGDIQAEFNKLFSLIEEDAVAAEEVAKQQHQKALDKAHKEWEKRKEQAKKAREQYLADEKALSAIIQEGEAQRFAMVSHTQEEIVEKQIKDRQKAARQQIHDATLLQEALDEIDRQGALQRSEAQKKDLEAEQKKREQYATLIQSSSAVTAPMGGDDSEFAKIAQEMAMQEQRTENAVKTLRDAIDEIDAMTIDQQAKYVDERASMIETITQLEIDSITRRADYTARLSLAQSKAAKEQRQRDAQALHDRIALTQAQKDAVNATVTGFNEMAKGAELWGASADTVQVIEMTASGIKAGADAIDYAAAAAKAYAVGNVVQGMGLSAASAGKVAAALAYAKGLTEIGKGGSVEAPDVSSATSGGGAGTSSSYGTLNSLTGTSAIQEKQQIEINLQYSGTDSQIAQALISGLNASSHQSGMTKLNPRILARS